VEKAEIGLHSAPIVANGHHHRGPPPPAGGAPPTRNTSGGDTGFDARTGKKLWGFTAIPGHGQKGNDTWLNESWTYTGNAGSWAQMSADEALNLVYVPVEAPTGDYYGGHRPGNNLYSSGIVALDIKTGTMKWAFQTTHHDIWDWDMPSAPILADITVDGQAIKAVAVPTKQNYLYVFDRTNGSPVWPIVETAVPKGDLPGEWYAPTQPIPSKPLAFGRQGQGRRPAQLHARTGTPRRRVREGPGWAACGSRRPELNPAAGKFGTLQLPGSTGGPNWQGGSIDPESNIAHLLEGRSGRRCRWCGSETLEHGLDQRRWRRRRPPAGGRQPADHRSALGDDLGHRPQQGRARVADRTW
jgi:quinoprotein glucose dehydrogenase